MSKDRKDFNRKIEELRKQYSENLPEKLDRIEELWTSLLHDKWDGEIFTELHFLIHKLGGSAASFGFKSTSEISRKVDTLFSTLVASKTTPNTEQKSRIGAYIAALKRSPSETGTVEDRLEFPDQFQSNISFPVVQKNKVIYLLDDE